MSTIQIKSKGKTAEVLIYNQIGPSFFEESTTAKAFAESIKAAGKVDTINVRINSPGGSVIDATAIHTTLRNHGAKIVTHIEGAALSAASLVAMAGDEIRMAAGALMMMHNPQLRFTGDAEAFRDKAAFLDKVTNNLAQTYANRSKQTEPDVLAMMKAETWLTAEEAKAMGFADVITGEATPLASFDLTMFHNVPAFLKEQTKMTTTAANLSDLRAACPGATSEFLLAQLDAQATLPQAQTAWMSEQQKQIANLQAKSGSVGVEPLPVRTTNPTAAVAHAFWELTAAYQAEGMTKPAAIRRATKERPDLHQSMLVEHNARYRS